MGRVSLYGLVDVEPELKQKTQNFNTKRPTVDPYWHSNQPVGLQVGLVWIDGVGLTG